MSQPYLSRLAVDPSATALSLLVCGIGHSANGLTVESETGFALWLEQTGNCVTLEGHQQATLVFAGGRPYIDFYALHPGVARRTHEMRVPCVDIIGLASLGDEEGRRDELIHERKVRSVH